MSRDDHRKELADLLAADQEKRRIAEAEIIRKEQRLLDEMAKLARINAENDALDAELVEARKAASVAGDGENEALQPPPSEP